jgi:4-hydroxy-tetrahydrodipicolinate synthase
MSVERIRRALTGISGVHVTPYDSSGAIDVALLGSVVANMAVAGVHNIVSAGNTGEFFALTSDEVLRVHDTAIAAVAGRALVTAAVGRSLVEATATARAAKRAGADAIMAHHPLDPFAAPQAQADYFTALAEASELPLVAYVRSDLISAADLARVAVHPNVAGVKFATGNLMLLAECLRATKGHPAVWVCGLAEGWAAPFYALGTRGFTSGLVNVDPKRSLAIWSALEAGDFTTARRLVDVIAPFEAMRTKFNNGANVTVVKEAMTLLGLAVGPVRLPGLTALEPADRNRLRSVLNDWGLRPLPASVAAE